MHVTRLSKRGERSECQYLVIMLTPHCNSPISWLSAQTHHNSPLTGLSGSRTNAPVSLYTHLLPGDQQYMYVQSKWLKEHHTYICSRISHALNEKLYFLGLNNNCSLALKLMAFIFLRCAISHFQQPIVMSEATFDGDGQFSSLRQQHPTYTKSTKKELSVYRAQMCNSWRYHDIASYFWKTKICGLGSLVK